MQLRKQNVIVFVCFCYVFKITVARTESVSTNVILREFSGLRHKSFVPVLNVVIFEVFKWMYLVILSVEIIKLSLLMIIAL